MSSLALHQFEDMRKLCQQKFGQAARKLRKAPVTTWGGFIIVTLFFMLFLLGFLPLLIGVL